MKPSKPEGRGRKIGARPAVIELDQRRDPRAAHAALYRRLAAELESLPLLTDPSITFGELRRREKAVSGAVLIDERRTRIEREIAVDRRLANEIASLKPNARGRSARLSRIAAEVEELNADMAAMETEAGLERCEGVDVRELLELLQRDDTERGIEVAEALLDQIKCQLHGIALRALSRAESDA